MMMFNRTHVISYQHFIVTMFLSHTISKLLTFVHKNKHTSCDPDHTPLGENFTRMGCHSSLSICVPNLKYVASPIQRQNGFPGHLTLTMSHIRLVCHHRLVLAMINLCTKFEISNFTHSKDMMGDPKFTKNWMVFDS